jgi:hypothetical protein
MTKRFLFSAITLVSAMAFSPTMGAQNVAPTPSAEVNRQKWNNSVPGKAAYVGKQSAPAPRHDISGIWDGSADGGFQAKGVNEHPAMRANDSREGGDPDESKIAHPLPYTPLGEEALKANKPAAGVRSVPAALSNDPVNICDPEGFPRMELFEMRTFEIIQAATQVIYLNQFDDVWRIIWTDGRELPKDPEPRWNGYSVGQWADDYTFVVQTVGMDERTWLDYAGRPHSSELRVEERFHRVNHDLMELTVTIDDPKMYTKPWLALNKFPLHLQPPAFDMREMFCSPSEIEDYNKQVGEPAALGAPPGNK